MNLHDLTFNAPKNGYAPAEDSWLLAEHLPNVTGKKCVDMGCGSGIQSAALAINGAAEIWSVDQNPHALETTKKLFEKYFPSARIHLVESHLFEALARETFDIIVFNPPYVPSEKIQWKEVDGGKKGREIIDAFLNQMPHHLAKNGACYLLQTSLNGKRTTEKILEEKNLKGTIIATQKLAFEELWVWKITEK
ncbi:MAG: HemK2/MTQ2 family protein methyltransferase [archaeon]